MSPACGLTRSAKGKREAMSGRDRRTTWSGLLGLALALVALPSHALYVAEGQSVRMAWAPATGPVARHTVYVSRNGAAFDIAYSLPAGINSIWIYGAPGDELAVLVRALGQDGSLGPASAVSETVRFVDRSSDASDFDRDGSAEILFQSGSGAGVMLWEMESPTSPQDWSANSVDLVAEQSLVLPSASAQVVAVSDFDNDDRSDLLVEEVDGSLAVGEIQPDGSVSTTVVAQLGADEWLVDSGDFDGDGRSDLLIANDTRADLSLWRLNGSSVLSVESAGSFDPTAKPVAAGDYDGDRRRDLCWLRTDGLLEFWYIDRTSHETVTRSFSYTKWRPVAAGDFDGDGRDDLLFVHTRWGNFSIWSFAAGRAAPAGVTDVAVSAIQGWDVVGTSDFDGNGKADILWRQAEAFKLSQLDSESGLWATRDVAQTIAADWQTTP